MCKKSEQSRSHKGCRVRYILINKYNTSKLLRIATPILFCPLTKIFKMSFKFGKLPNNYVKNHTVDSHFQSKYIDRWEQFKTNLCVEQDFRKTRPRKFVYICQTQHIHRIIWIQRSFMWNSSCTSYRYINNKHVHTKVKWRGLPWPLKSIRSSRSRNSLWKMNTTSTLHWNGFNHT